MKMKVKKPNQTMALPPEPQPLASTSNQMIYKVGRQRYLFESVMTVTELRPGAREGHRDETQKKTSPQQGLKWGK